MEKEFLPIGLVMHQKGNGASRNGSSSGNYRSGAELTVTMKNGLERHVTITDPKDADRIPKIMEKVNNGSDSAAYQLAGIIKKYDQIAAGSILLGHGYTGEGWEAIGNGFDELSVHDEAINAYKLSAVAGHLCGKCKLGQYYAEGKGCNKNLELAKLLLEEAATQCDSAEEILDQYGLR